MDATEVFSKITYLEAGMKMLVAQKGATSEEIQQLMEAVEAKAKPTINLNSDALAKLLANLMTPLIPALNASAVAKQLGPVLLAGLPTPDTLREAGREAAALLAQEFTRQGEQRRAYAQHLDKTLKEAEQRVAKLVGSVPHTVGLDAFYDYRVRFLFFGLPAALATFALFFALFLRVPQKEYDRVVTLSEMRRKLGFFYSQQIRDYKRSNPKTADRFPEYQPTYPATPAAK